MISKGKYFDGRTAVAYAVEITVEGSQLRIIRDGETIARWPVSAVYRDPAHVVSVVLGCASGDDRVEVADPSILNGTGIGTSVWAHRDLSKMKSFAIPAVIVIVLLIGLGLWHSRVLTRYLTKQVTPAMETKLFTLMTSRNTEAECSLKPSQQAALDKVVDRLFEADRAAQGNLKVLIMKGPLENAFTLPTELIWMYQGLMKDMKNPDEFAGVLAHEIEHVQQRHVVESILRATLFTALLNFVAGDVSGFVLIDPSTAAQILSLKLSREMEREADAGAVTRLHNVGVSTAGLASFFSRGAVKELPKGLGFLSTHPENEARSKLFKSGKVTESIPPVLTEAEWLDLKSSCKL